MNKLKTHRGAAKRFKCLGSGNYVRKSINRRHILSTKTTKRKRHLRGTTMVSCANKCAIKQMLKD